ncbi:MAG: DUF4921 family protein [bacterium]
MDRHFVPAGTLHHSIHTSDSLSQDPDQSTPLKVPNIASITATPSHHKQLILDTDASITEIRRDYLHEYYVLVAPKRRDRPYDTGSHDHPLIETADSPRLEQQATILDIPSPTNTHWAVKVVENKFPALILDNAKAYGKQEIVIDTPIANQAFGELDADQIALILEAYKQRSTELLKQDHIKYVAVFRNDGYEAGASLAHAHSQIIALPLIPPDIAREAQAAQDYQTEHQKDPYDAIIRFEKSTNQRIIFENEDWIAFCPYASRWQMEAWVMPKANLQALEECSTDQFASLAPILKMLAKPLTDAQINYNLIIEQGIQPGHRLTLKFCGRNVVSPWGGLEVGTGMIINVIPPESAAKWYRTQAI